MQMPVQRRVLPANSAWDRSPYNLLVLVQVVYVHPTDLPGTQVEGLHPAMVDFLADTTRTAASMVRHRVLSSRVA